MKTAMKCRSGIYRVDDDGQIYIFDSMEELTQHYSILGVLTPSIALTFVVERRDQR